MRAYAHQSKNRQMETAAAEIRIRAEHRLGEMLIAQKETIGLNTGAQGIGTSAVPQQNRTPTLADIGIDKKLSAHSQKVAAIPDAEFEGIVDDWREGIEAQNERVTTNIIAAAEKAAMRCLCRKVSRNGRRCRVRIYWVEKLPVALVGPRSK